MSKMQVLESTCDRCTKEQRVPYPDKTRAAVVLPPGWLHVSGDTQKSTVFSLDLCEECKLAVLAAAGVAV